MNAGVVAQLAGQLVSRAAWPPRMGCEDGTACPLAVGWCSASPNISPEEATNTRVARRDAITASSTVAVAPAIAAIVRRGARHESGTNVGAARW